MKLDTIEGKQNEHLYRHPKTGKIYYREYRAERGEKFVSLRTTNLNDARIKRDETRLQWLGFKPKKQVVRLFDELWIEFLATKKTKAKNTYESIERHGRLHLIPYFKDFYASEINEESAKLYVAFQWQKSPGRKLFNDIKYLNMFLKFCFNKGLISRIPQIEYPDPPRAAGKVYSDDEISRLLKSASGDLQIQILMAVSMGMRLSEILFLSWDRVDLEKRTIHLRAQDTKNRKARTFGISNAALDQLRIKHFINKELEINSTYVFNHPNDLKRPIGRAGNKTAWKSCKRRAKVSGRFHDLRHTFLTNAFKRTINPALICHYAGLSLEEAQRTYLHFTVEDTRPVAELIQVPQFGENSGNQYGL